MPTYSPVSGQTAGSGGGGGGGGFGPWGVEAVLNKEVGDANGTTLLAAYDPTKEYLTSLSQPAVANPLGVTTILGLIVSGGDNPPVPTDVIPRFWLTDTTVGTIDFNGTPIMWIRDGGIISGGGTPGTIQIQLSSSTIFLDVDNGDINADYSDMGVTDIFFALLSRTRT
jgi:hypothetical protein